jgi:hypothetical protein
MKGGVQKERRNKYTEPEIECTCERLRFIMKNARPQLGYAIEKVLDSIVEASIQMNHRHPKEGRRVLCPPFYLSQGADKTAAQRSTDNTSRARDGFTRTDFHNERLYLFRKLVCIPGKGPQSMTK